MDNPELVMFAPRHAGLGPVTFLIVIPITSMIVVARAIWSWKPLFAMVKAAPRLSCLAYVVVCSLMPWFCLYVKRRYDRAYGYDRELRSLLSKEDLTVETVRITGVVPQQAEAYAEGDDGPRTISFAHMRNGFVPEEGSRLAIIHTGDTCLIVRSDPKTSSLIEA